MVSTISIDDFKKKLKYVFCNENKTTHKYSEIWLSEVDFGGLYQTDKFVVNVKTEHEISSCNEEIKYIVTHLFELLTKDERSMIWRVDVYNSFEEIHSNSEDILVYTESNACTS